MESLPTGSVDSWLTMAAAGLGPLMALLLGFAGADWWLRRAGRRETPTLVKGGGVVGARERRGTIPSRLRCEMSNRRELAL
jgi:hypothetical protein